MKDYYSLLGIDRKATKQEIKKSYRLLAIKFHPDKNDHPDSSSKFIAITEAYDVLSNKKSRAQYDLFVWEKLKREKESADSFEVVVPPRESTRTRRNKAQRQRGLKFQQEKVKSKKNLFLLSESFRITGRYVTHILGLTLALVIGMSLTSDLSKTFSKGILPSLFILSIILGVLLITFWIFKNAYSDFKKDIEALFTQLSLLLIYIYILIIAF